MSSIVWSCEDSVTDLEDSLFTVFKDTYGIDDVEVFFKDGSSLLIYKYNVLGLSLGEGVFKVYDNPSLDKALCKFYVEDVVKIYVI